MRIDETLVSTDWLARHLDDPRVVVADVRWALQGRRGAELYAEGHVPGARFVDLDRDLAAIGEGPGRHPLPDAARFAATLSRLGVTRESTVVAYDDAGGAVAARLWWLLRYFGLDNGRVLDGGFPAWTAEGRPVTTDAPGPAAAPRLELTPRREMVVDADGLDGAVLLDARAPERYEGRVEPVDPRAGHIPGARSAPFSGNLSDGRFLPEDALRARYAALGALDAPQVVAYCGSGVTACHALLALALAGRDDVRLYEGSWSDWSSDPSRPVATGPDLA
jgi:thiosulfate/3-mercaptopyruvate sulfurtransferase